MEQNTPRNDQPYDASCVIAAGKSLSRAIDFLAAVPGYDFAINALETIRLSRGLDWTLENEIRAETDYGFFLPAGRGA